MPKKRRDSKKKTGEKGIYRLNRSNNGYLIRVTRKHGLSNKTVFRQKKIKAENISQAIQAREALREELEKEINLETHGMSTPLAQVTIADLAEYYLESRKQESIKPITLNQLKVMLNRFVLPIVGLVKISEVNRSTLKYFHAELHNLRDFRRQSYSNNTMKQAFTVLKGLIRWAYREEIIDSDPTNVSLQFRAGKKQKEKEALSFEEAMIVLNEGKLHLPLKEYLMIAFALIYGCRHGEMAALKWDDIDLSRNLIFITKTVTAQKLSDKTKSGKDNVLVIIPQIKSLLINYRREFNEVSNPLGLVFSSRSHGKYRESPSINYSIRKICRLLEIDKDITVHCLRHSCISIMIQKNISIEIVRKIVNHSEGSRITRDYIHSSPESSEAALVKVWDSFRL